MAECMDKKMLNGFSHNLAELFLTDLRAVAQGFLTSNDTATGPSGFHH